MTWPKKHTREIIIGDEQYLWHISAKCLAGKGGSITIGKAKERFFLYLDPYVWDTLIEPSTIRCVIEWAKAAGWTAEKGPTRSVAYSRADKTYIWLPDNVRHLYQSD